MMNALEARNKAKKLIDEKSEAQLKKIEDLIHKSASGGLFEITLFDEAIIPTVALKLKGFGYTVHPTAHYRDESSTKISW